MRVLQALFLCRLRSARSIVVSECTICLLLRAVKLAKVRDNVLCYSVLTTAVQRPPGPYVSGNLQAKFMLVAVQIQVRLQAALSLAAAVCNEAVLRAVIHEGNVAPKSALTKPCNDLSSSS